MIKNISRFRYYKDEALHHFLKGKAVKLPYPPRKITVFINGFCTNHCMFCTHHCEGIDENKKEKIAHLYKPKFNISYDDFVRVIDKLHEAGIPQVHICAVGEPLVHNEFMKMLDYVISKYGEVSFQTNLNTALMNKFYDDIISRKDHISCITTDLMSADKEMHNSLKIGSDFVSSIEIMRRISKDTNHAIKFAISYILTKKNYKGISELPGILLENGIRNFSLTVGNLYPYEINEFTKKDNCYFKRDTEITRELDKLREYCDKHRIVVSIPDPVDMRKDNSFCYRFWTSLQINNPSLKVEKDKWVGTITPCVCPACLYGDLYSLGNLFDFKNFMDFWNSKNMIRIRKHFINKEFDKVSPYCSDCMMNR
jgi:organic radical activating enzyme